MSRQQFEELIDGLSAVLMTVDFGTTTSLELALAKLEGIDGQLTNWHREALRSQELNQTLTALRAAIAEKSVTLEETLRLQQALEALTQRWYDQAKDWQHVTQQAMADIPGKLVLPDAADPALLAEFIANTRLTGDELESLIEQLRTDKTDAPAKIRGILHTLKGEAGMLGLDALSAILHATESYLELGSPAWEQADELIKVRDFIIDALGHYEMGGLPDDGCSELLNSLIAATGRASRRTTPAASPAHNGPSHQRRTSQSAASTHPKMTQPPPSLPTIWDEQELELVAEFLSESQESLVGVDQVLLNIERDGPDAERVNRLFRAFHTMKGVASFLRLKQIVELSHNTETMLSSVRSGTLAAEAGVIDLVFDATTLLRSLLDAVKSALESTVPLQKVLGVDDLISRIKAATMGAIPQPALLAAQPGNKLGEILLENGALSAKQLSVALSHQKETGRLLGEQLIAEGSLPAKVLAQALRGQSAGTGTVTKTREVLKVDLERVDCLVEAIGELVIVESMVSNAPEIRALPPHIRNYLGQFAKITRELQEQGMFMRMVPLRSEFQKMARMVRDLTRRINKQVRVELRGENTEMDRSMVEQIADPLVHLIRNAVDHGIETPAERLALGKSETGTVVLSASHEGSSIVIEISDDGRGINCDRVLEKAVAQGLVQENASLTDSQIYDLLFMPGFSTAAQVTEISGRGVGMDVVKRNIEAVRGRIITTSTPGRGSTFRLMLPLTLAIIDGMVIRCGNERFILPTLNTVESLQPTPDMLFRIAGQHEHILVRGKSLPLLRLGRLLEVDGTEPDPTKALVVIVESVHANVALLVDEVIMKHQVVIKTLGTEIDTGQLFAGAAILSNGRVGLIVNVDSLVESTVTLHNSSIHAVA